MLACGDERQFFLPQIAQIYTNEGTNAVRGGHLTNEFKTKKSELFPAHFSLFKQNPIATKK
jgi:hypothetical protein